jgi:hypothetical protein
MAQRLYFGTETPREWLEARRSDLLEAKASGKRIVLIVAAFVKSEAKVEVSVGEMLRQVEHDLCVRFPQDYDPSVYMPIKHSRPRYLYN